MGAGGDPILAHVFTGVAFFRIMWTMTKNTVSLIGGHYSRNGVEKNWPARVVFLNGGFGMGDEHQDSMVIFRTAGVAERPSDLYTHPLAKTLEFAEYHYQKSFKPTWDTLPPGYIKTFTNEACGTDRHEMETYIAYEKNMCQLAYADGHILGIGKFASGTPRWDSGLWQELYAPWLVEAWDKYQAIYTRHIYGYPNSALGDPGDLVDGNGNLNTNVPTSAQRIIDELDLLKKLGWGGGVAFTETGLQGGYGVADWNRFYFQITKFEQVLRPYADHVIGFCWWECGKTEDWDADYTAYLKQMTPYMTENALPKWEPKGEPMPEERYKAIIVKLPQDATLEEVTTAVTKSFALRHDWTQSHDTVLNILDPAKVLPESYVKFMAPERDAETIKLVEAAGYSWQPLYDEPESDKFTFDHWPTNWQIVTQEFRANPQNYEQFGLPGHEGVDIRAYHGEPIYAVADGIVSDVHPVEDGHNYGIFLRVAHKESYETTYCHLKETIRTKGEAIKAGDIIGLADNTGNSFGDHLHLTLKRTGYVFNDECGNQWPYNIIDPTPYLATFSGVVWPGGSPGFPCPDAPVEPPPTGETVDVLSYQMAHPAAWRVVYNGSHGEDVQDMDLGGGLWVRRKGNNAEWWRSGSYLIHDTSPENVNGRSVCYTIYKDGKAGQSQKNPQYMMTGETWQETGSHFVQFKYKDGCGLVTEPPTGNNRNSCTLLWRNKAYKFPKLPVTLDVIALMTTNNEVQLYAKTNAESATHYKVPVGLPVGWVGWDAPWGEANIEELYFDRGTLKQEPERYCNWE